jgi:hypothetical protein
MIYSKVISIIDPAGQTTVRRLILTVDGLCHDPNGVSIEGVNERNAGTSIDDDVSTYDSGTALKELLELSIPLGFMFTKTELPCVVTGASMDIFLILTAEM